MAFEELKQRRVNGGIEYPREWLLITGTRR
jgi:hypothetical protein